MRRFWLLIMVIVLQVSCNSQTEKINGISFVGGRDIVDASHIRPVLDINANWACLMPFGFMRTIDAPQITFDVERQWWGERKVGVETTAKLFQDKGVKVMVKPQIWVWRGEFTGTIQMNNEEDWRAFEKHYTDFILSYAKLAETLNAEMFCIGTELHETVKARPAFWRALIKKVRKVYKGKLTYAENWDTFDNVPFWNELDYIGVDAYFPLSEEKTPTIESLKTGWQKHKAIIKEVSQKVDRPVLFTEYGYRSVDYAGSKPWDSSRANSKVNLEAQTNGLQALYSEFWNEDWFAGGFVWKWFDYHDRAGGSNNSRFTPQNKPAEILIREHYKAH
ncbi:glycoside hydrolase [Sungkyunkwania multivorans]|uniref:Glycoside hydrolase n=1 Tax=Sungkyunkwania multivorans TaxID=1173618 RepID=A0ABW3D1V3_9FLAO